MDPNPNAANLLRTLFVAKLWSWEKAAFFFWRWGWVKILEQKKKLWPVPDLDPNPGFGSGFKSGIRIRIWIRIRIRIQNPKLTSGRIWIRDRIRNFCFGSATLPWGFTNELSRLPCATSSPVTVGVHPGAVLAHPGSIEANTKPMKACPGSLQDHWGPRESSGLPWSPIGSALFLYAHPGALYPYPGGYGLILCL